MGAFAAQNSATGRIARSFPYCKLGITATATHLGRRLVLLVPCATVDLLTVAGHESKTQPNNTIVGLAFFTARLGVSCCLLLFRSRANHEKSRAKKRAEIDI